MQQDVLFGVDILLHILVDIQVVGGKVRHHGHVGALPHGDELEAGKLHHGAVLRLDGLNLRQQGLADVAPQVDSLALGFQQLCDDGGGGGFPVAAGDGVNLAGAQLEEHLHLAGDGGAPLAGGLQLGQVVLHPRGAEDDVLPQILQVVFPQDELDTPLLKGLAVVPQLLQGTLIPGGNQGALLLEQADEGHVAAANAAEGDGLALDAGKKLLFVHRFPFSNLQASLSGGKVLSSA